jgi:hypothetical protein
MAITLDEVLDHATRWFDTVMIHGGSAAEQAVFFLHPHPRIFVVNVGASIDMEEQARLHRQWKNEVHRLGSFIVTPLSRSPERVRAVGTVYWQAEYRDRKGPNNVIKSVVGEEWILERVPDGSLKFVLYINGFHHILPDSAPFGL